MTEVSCVEEELLFGAACTLLRRSKWNTVESARETLRDREQFERAERFMYQCVRAGLLCRDRRPSVGAREEHNRNVSRRGIVLQFAAQLEAALARHVHVEHDDTRKHPRDLSARGDGVMRLDHVDVRDFERRPQQCAQCRVVVDEQDAQDP